MITDIDILHMCGHTTILNVKNIFSDRDIKKQKSQPCNVCVERDIKAARGEAGRKGWPTPYGDKRSVGWAVLRRSQVVADLTEHAAHASPELRDMCLRIFLRERNAGKWLTDSRDGHVLYDELLMKWAEPEERDRIAAELIRHA